MKGKLSIAVEHHAMKSVRLDLTQINFQWVLLSGIGARRHSAAVMEEYLAQFLLFRD
jgi:hypothetical protein